MKTQSKLYVGLGGWALVWFGMFCLGTWLSVWLVPILAVLYASPYLLFVLATKLENRHWRQLLSLKDGSWAFLIGDTFVLTTAAANNSLAWRDLSKQGWHASWWWPIVCLLAGMAAGAGFHAMDSSNYCKASMAAALRSPTKVAHDGVAFTVLFGGLLYGGLPLMFHWSGASIVLLVCIGLWLALGICDAVRGLDPRKLHVKWSTEAFCRID